MREGVKRDIPLLLDNWRSLIARKNVIRDYVPAHWNGDLSHEGFVARYDYVDTLYTGIAKAVEEGSELGELFTEYDLKTAFPDLDGTPGFTNARVHNGSILALWTDRTGTESASNALATLIEEDGLEAAVSKIKTAHAKGSGEYYFLEAEFNALGYRYLGEESFPEAIAVFQLNVEMNPDSWNVYDSLGEAYMRSGQQSLAIENYDKSLELNADNENGKRMLAEIQTTLAKE
jgi:tetratricopeptide (TPR) repeat protein